jgi:hypothetical protein
MLHTFLAQSRFIIFDSAMLYLLQAGKLLGFRYCCLHGGTTGELIVPISKSQMFLPPLELCKACFHNPQGTAEHDVVKLRLLIECPILQYKWLSCLLCSHVNLLAKKLPNHKPSTPKTALPAQ